jgi:hypothetical protein
MHSNAVTAAVHDRMPLILDSDAYITLSEMNSEVVRAAVEADFSTPIRWTGIAFKSAPTSPGVYVFQLAEGKSIHRLKGGSGIIYVGSTARGRGGLKQRLRNHTKSSFLNLIRTEIGDVEVSWRVVPTHERALFEEAQILWKYLQDHLELPPMNRQRSSLKGYRKLRTVLEDTSMSPEKKSALWEQWSQIGWFEKP